jgi:ribosomal protein S10
MSPAATKAKASKPKIRIKIKAFDHRVIDQASRAIIEAAERTELIVAGPNSPTNQD